MVWAIFSSFNDFPTFATTTLFTPTKILVAGGGIQAFIIDYHVENNVTASLFLPSGWITDRVASLSFSGTTSADPFEEAVIRDEDDEQNYDIQITSGETITTTWDFGTDGINKEVHLFLRSSHRLGGIGVTGTVNVDTMRPSSHIMVPGQGTHTISPQTYFPATFTILWQGGDETSGIAGYDLQVMRLGDAEWTNVVTNTISTQTIFTAANGETYAFRLRARDVAGHVEEWSLGSESVAKVDAEGPSGVVDISTVGSTSVLLLIDANDNLSGVTHMKVSLADEFGSAEWEEYATPKTLSFGGPSPSQFLVYVQFRDLVGNESAIICVPYGEATCPGRFEDFKSMLPMIRLRD